VVHRLFLVLTALLAVSACSVAPFRTDRAAATSPQTQASRNAGAGPVLQTPTEEIFQPDAEPVIEAPPPQIIQPTPRERPRRPAATLSPASRALVTQAEAQRKKGDLPGASVTLDRAMRIEPNNPLLWIEMGRLRMDQRNYPQAESMGRKALAMSVGDDATQSAAWELIAQSLRARGRNAEAEEALSKSRAAAPR
jgi:tetratricopeptide (TPR) repeat protein